MNFVEEMTGELVRAEKAQSAEARHESAEKTRKFSLQAIVNWLAAFLAGDVKENVRVEMTTDKVRSFIALGGLPEFAEIFREFFSQKPGMFFIYDLPFLWEKLQAFPEEQKFVGKVYWNRAMVGPVDEFQYAIKAIMCIYVANSATTEQFQLLAKNLISRHEKLLMLPENGNVARMLDSISKTGKYYMPSNIPTPAQGAREKGDDDFRNNKRKGGGGNHNSLPAKKYANPKDVGANPGTPAAALTPASSDDQEKKVVGNLGEALAAAGVKGKKKRAPKLTLKAKKAAAQLLNGVDVSRTASV